MAFAMRGFIQRRKPLGVKTIRLPRGPKVRAFSRIDRYAIPRAKNEGRPPKILGTMKRIPDPPSDLSHEAADLWRSVVRDYVLEPTALKRLEDACRALDRQREAQRIIAKEGCVDKDRFGQSRLHPAVLVEE